jgi:hypothetical protein
VEFLSKGISSPGSHGTEMASFRIAIENNPNASDVLVENFGMICKKCRERGVASQCAHGYHTIPTWKSLATIYGMREMYGEANAETLSMTVLVKFIIQF